MPIQKRNKPSLDAIKKSLLADRLDPNVLFYYGHRWPSIHHARMRIGCSKLNYDLCYNLHVTANPSCPCGALIENAHHFFLICPNYDNIRLPLFNAISVYTEVTIDTILYGNQKLKIDLNKVIFDAVHDNIVSTNRFM